MFRFFVNVYRKLVPSFLRDKFKLGARLTKFFPRKKEWNLYAHMERSRLKFEVQLVEHCNLNCAGCNHFSPLAEPEFLEIEEFEHDMERLGGLFDHVCESILLLGGEPLLHPEIVSFVKAARENFGEGVISIVTNGILLPQQTEAFWRACHDYDTSIAITQYPIKLDMEGIHALAQKFDVEVRWFASDKNVFFSHTIDLEGRGNPAKNFARCGEANNCITLKHGRLFPCSFAPHTHHFNKKFGENLEVTEADYIDIYKETNKRAIMRRLSQPIPFCRYCTKYVDLAQRRTFQWGLSKGGIDEWL